MFLRLHVSVENRCRDARQSADFQCRQFVFRHGQGFGTEFQTADIADIFSAQFFEVADIVARTDENKLERAQHFLCQVSCTLPFYKGFRAHARIDQTRWNFADAEFVQNVRPPARIQATVPHQDSSDPGTS